MKINNMNIKKKTALLFSGIAVAGMLFAPAAVFADSKAPYVSFGADLSASDKQTVESLLGVSDSELSSDTVITVTNADEHQYLDGQISSNLIGSKALSSCKVVEASDGAGINVTTKNITYCTPAMYENALATAGMKDATVTVAGPYNISGTAALVGAMKAYASMTGTTVNPSQVSAASNELATTGQVAKNTGEPEKTSELVAAVKSQVADQNLSGDTEIGNAVDSTAKELGLNLTADDRQRIIDLMKNLSKLDLNADNLAEQAKNVYQNAVNDGLDLSKYGISTDELKNFVTNSPNIFKTFIAWLKGIFGQN